MITREIFNQLIGIKENYEMPEKLLGILLEDQKREKLFCSLLEYEQDFSKDWFTDIFQDEHGDRDALKQDFTPDCLCELMNQISGAADSCADICAGTGGLTIKKWSANPNGCFYCEEISSRTIPMLLMNLSIRNMQGVIVHGNSLTGEIETVYQLDKGEKFSEISYTLPVASSRIFPTVIMNPPYSLKWNDVGKYQEDLRFKDYGIPPKKAADYAFLLHGLAKLDQGGELFAILPHGVLFRGNSEGKIRENLIRANLIDAVIGLPDKLFAHTSIPVCIMVLKKNRAEKDILFIDASKNFEKGAKQNVMKPEHIGRIASVYRDRRQEEKFSSRIDFQTLEDNQFNLNIPRYVDTFEREPVPDLCEVLSEIEKTDMEIKETEGQIFQMMNSMYGTNPKAEQELKDAMEIFERDIIEKYGKQFIGKCLA